MRIRVDAKFCVNAIGFELLLDNTSQKVITKKEPRAKIAQIHTHEKPFG